MHANCVAAQSYTHPTVCPCPTRRPPAMHRATVQSTGAARYRQFTTGFRRTRASDPLAAIATLLCLHFGHFRLKANLLTRLRINAIRCETAGANVPIYIHFRLNAGTDYCVFLLVKSINCEDLRWIRNRIRSSVSWENSASTLHFAMLTRCKCNHANERNWLWQLQQL